MQYYYTDQNKQERPKRTPPGKNLFAIVLIALLVTLAGDILGGIISVGLSYFIADGGWRFITDNYLPFLGSFIAILLYLAKFDPDLYRTCLSSSKGGQKRNNAKWLTPPGTTLRTSFWDFRIPGSCPKEHCFIWTHHQEVSSTMQPSV